MVIDQNAQNKHYKSDKKLVSDSLMLLAAGHETTVHTMELAKKPCGQRLLRKELKQHAEENRCSLSISRNVVKERMRRGIISF